MKKKKGNRKPSNKHPSKGIKNNTLAKLRHRKDFALGR